ncbi:MAG: molybdopterin converting factor subunit 1 [Thermaurantiacus sp.]
MAAPVRLLYFAWVRERIGTGTEELEIAAPMPIATLLDLLRPRSAGHAAALADTGRIRVALNQEFVGWDAEIGPGDELALFPPVTGG